MRSPEYRYSDEFEYKNFRTEKEQKEVFNYCRALAEYIRHEKIKNLILPDTSARPAYVGVKEYLSKAHPDEDKNVDMYFINPNGVEGNKLSTLFGLVYFLEEHEWLDQEEYQKKFTETYTKLVTHKDEPTLVFDTCIHTGETMKRIKNVLEGVGFTDVRLGSVSEPDHYSEVEADMVLTIGEPEKFCYPFAKETLVETTNDSITAQRSTNPESIKRGQQLRKEIRHIIDSRLEQ